MDFKNWRKKMTERTLIIEQKITTIGEVLDYIDTVKDILVYSGKELIGHIFYDSSDSSTRSPTSWYYLKGMDFADRECYDSLSDLVNCINVSNINIKVLYE